MGWMHSLIVKQRKERKRWSSACSPSTIIDQTIDMTLRETVTAHLRSKGKPEAAIEMLLTNVERSLAMMGEKLDREMTEPELKAMQVCIDLIYSLETHELLKLRSILAKKRQQNN